MIQSRLTFLSFIFCSQIVWNFWGKKNHTCMMNACETWPWPVLSFISICLMIVPHSFPPHFTSCILFCFGSEALLFLTLACGLLFCFVLTFNPFIAAAGSAVTVWRIWEIAYFFAHCAGFSMLLNPKIETQEAQNGNQITNTYDWCFFWNNIPLCLNI